MKKKVKKRSVWIRKSDKRKKRKRLHHGLYVTHTDRL